SSVQLYILIDPAYWPGKSIISRVLSKKNSDSKLVRAQLGWKALFKKTFWELVYIFTKPNYTVLAIKQNGNLNFLVDLKDKPIYVIRNQNDYFCSPDIEVALQSHPNIRYVKLPGEHDDYYTNPQPYIALLTKSI